jgi:membrane protein
MVLSVGFLLAVSLILSAAVAALGNSIFSRIEILLQIVTFVMSFAVITVLFAMLYKVLPNVKIDWEDVWIGAAITALLFETGKVLIGLYLGKASVASSFGAAGPFVVLMVWVYYSSQIFLLGAEFTFAYAHRDQRQPATDPYPSHRHPAFSDTVASVPRQDQHIPPVAVHGEPSVRAGWAKRIAAAAAAGVLTGLMATRFIRSSSKSR